jgi:hypothetical protein
MGSTCSSSSASGERPLMSLQAGQEPPMLICGNVECHKAKSVNDSSLARGLCFAAAGLQECTTSSCLVDFFSTRACLRGGSFRKYKMRRCTI